MKLIIEALVGGVLVPAAFAAAALLSLRRLGRGSPSAARSIGATALAGGCLAGNAALGLAPLLPQQAWHWLPYVALLACVAGVLEAAAGLRPAASWPLRTAAALVAAWLLVPTWDSIAAQRTWWIAGMAAFVLALWGMLLVLAERLPAVRLSLLLWLSFLTAAIVLERSGNLKFAQLAGIVTATLGVFWLLELIRKFPRSDGHTPGAAPSFASGALAGAAPGLAVLLPGLMLSGHFNSYSEVPLASYVLVSAAPAALWLSTLGPLKGLPERKALLVQSAATLSFLIGAVALAFMAESG